MATRGRLKNVRRTRLIPKAFGIGMVVGLVALIGLRAGAQNRSEFVPTLEFGARLRQRLQHLNRLESQKLWDDWVQQCQALVDEYPDGVVPRDEEFYIGLRFHLANEMDRLPPAVKQAYRRRFEGQARDLYQKAAAAQDEALMRQVYGRFRHTSQGAAALEWLAGRALDAGDPEIARLAYARALREQVSSPLTLLKYGLAAVAAGYPQEAQQAFRRAETEYGAQPIRIGGENTTVADAARRLAALAKPAPLAAWNSFQGPLGLRQMSGEIRPPITKRWEYVFPAQVVNPVSGVRYNVVIGAYGGSRSRLTYLTFPVVFGDQVILQGPRSIASLRLEDGQEVWSNEEFELKPEDKAPGGDIKGVAAGQQRMAGYRSGSRAIQAAPVVQGGLLFTRMPVTSSDSARRARFTSGFALAALDARSGKQLWQRVHLDDPGGEVWNLPAVLGNTLFTGVAKAATGITEYRATAIRAGTGEVIWSTYLGGGTDPMLMTDGSPPAVRDGMLWIESSLHTLNGLDLVTGEVRYVYHYQPRSRPYSGAAWIDITQVPNEPVALLPAGGKRLVFASRWGDQVIAFDPTTARLFWSAPKTSSPTLFALDTERAYLCGQDIQAYELETGAKLWAWAPPDRGGNFGFAVLANGRIYAPVDGKVYVLNAADAREVAVLDLTADLGESPGYVGLHVVGNRLIVTTREKAVCYEGDVNDERMKGERG
ncbi:MAG: PQQ-binding-like beta-propeller repeat protein [Armatimonadetes bacterium]|nr:PQQ-binding-like beta-propeller repeat protein [Armatimonadota bacterium]